MPPPEPACSGRGDVSLTNAPPAPWYGPAMLSPARIALALALTFTAISAHARHPGGPGAAPHIVLERVDTRYENGRLTIDYKIANGSWRWLANRQVEVGATVSLGGEGGQRWDFRLGQIGAEGSFWIDRCPDAMTVAIAFRDFGSQNLIQWMDVGGIPVVSLTVPVDHDQTGRPGAPGPGPGPTGPVPVRPPVVPPPVRINWAGQPQVIAACGQAFFGQAGQTSCLDAVARFPVDPTASIVACHASLFGDANALACLQRVALAPGDATELIRACHLSLFGDANALACIDHGRSARFEPSGIVRACHQAMFGDATALRCIAIAATAARDPSPTLAACRGSMRGDEAVMGCLERGLTR